MKPVTITEKALQEIAQQLERIANALEATQSEDRLLTFTEAGETINLTMREIAILVDGGALPSKTVAGTRKVKLSDVQNYIKTL